MYRMCDPPEGCNRWFANAVHEWPLNASKECLLDTEPVRCSISNLKSNVLTFSLLCRQSDSIQCYVYWEGLSHRFNPMDKVETETVLKDIFMNKDYLQDARWQKLWSSLKEKIQDTQFAYFRNVSHL